MAGGNFVVKTGLTLDTSSAINQLKALGNNLDYIKQKYEELYKKTNRSDDDEQELKKLKSAYDAAAKMYNDYKNSVLRVQKALSDMSGMTLAELQKTEKLIMNEQKQIRVEGKKTSKANKEWAEELARGLRYVREEMANLKNGFTDIWKQTKNIDNMGLTQLERLLQRLRESRSAMSENPDGTFNEKKYEKLGSTIQQVILKIDKLKSTQNTIDDPTKATNEQLQHTVDLYQKLIASGELNKKQTREATSVIAKMNKELASRSMSILNNPSQFSQKEIQSAVKYLREYGDSLGVNHAKQKQFNDAIANGEAQLRKYSDAQKRSAMQQQLNGELSKLTDDAIKQQVKYWEMVVNGMDATDKGYKKYLTNLQKAQAEQQRRADIERKAVELEERRSRITTQRASTQNLTTNLTTASVTELRESIKVVEQLRDAQAKGSSGWKYYAQMVDNATAYLKSFDDAAKQAEERRSRITTQRASTQNLTTNLTSASVTELRESIKVVEQLRDAQAKGSSGWKYYAQMVDNATAYLKSFDDAAKQAEERRSRITTQRSSTQNLTTNLNNASVTEIRESIKVVEQLRDAHSKGSVGWKHYAQMIENANAHLKSFDDEAKKKLMETNLSNVTTLSKSALTEQSKYWQSMVDGAKLGSAELTNYEAKLKAVTDEENRRAKEKGKTLSSDIIGGGWSGTIKETETAIKLLREYRSLLNSRTDAAAISDVDKALAILQADTNAVKNGFKDVTELLDKAKTVGDGSFDGTVHDLQSMKKALNEYRESLSTANPDKIKEVDNLIAEIDYRTKHASISQEQLNKAISSPKTASYNELKAAAEKVAAELKDVAANQDEYNRKAAQLKTVNDQIKSLERGWNEHASALQNAVSRLKTYVMVYMGFNQFMQKSNELYRSNLELSDQMANVQKVTNMTNQEIIALTDNLQDIDSRTATEQLMQFAEQAGKLGVYTQQGVSGMQQFVEMGERINATLGEEIGGAQAIADLAKVNDILGQTDKVMQETGNATTGLRDALNATGSAILNVGNSSSASYASIVDFVSRLGAVGATTNMSMQQLIAFGGTLDALKVNSEAGSTALAQFISAVSNNAAGMAKTAGLQVESFKKLVKKDMFAAVNLLVSKIQDGTVSAQELMNSMTGRSRTNVNIRNVINLLASHTEMLNQQLALANEGYQSAIENGGYASVMSIEFARVNENAAGIIARLGNRLRETFVNSTVVSAVTSLVKAMADFVGWFTSGTFSAQALQVALAGLVTYLIAASKAFATLSMQGIVSFVSGMVTSIKQINSFSRALVVLRNGLQALAANFASVAVAGVAMLALGLKKVYDESRKFARVTSEASKQLYEETRQASLLFSELRSLNTEEERRSAIIAKINNKYGTMLGYMLSEKAAANEIANAYDLIIAKMNQKMNMQVREKMMGNIAEESAEKERKAIENMVDEIQNLVGSGELAGQLQYQLSAALEKAFAENPDATKEELFEYIKAQFVGNEVTTKATGVRAAMKINPADVLRGSIMELIGARMKRDSETRAVDAMNQGSMSASQEQLDKALNKINSEVAGIINSIKDRWDNDRDSVTDKEIQDMLARLDSIVSNSEYQEAAKSNATAAKNIENFKLWIRSFQNELKKRNPWGSNNGSYQQMTSEELKDLIDNIEKAAGFINEGNFDYEGNMAEIATRYNIKNGMNPDEVRKLLYAEATKIRNEQDRRNMTRGAVYKWDENGSGGRTKLKKQIQDEMNAYLQELDEYFERQREILKMQRDADEVTEEEYNRRMEANDMKHYDWRIKLRNMYLERANVLSQAEMNELNTIIDEGGDKFTKEGIGKTAKLLSQFGGALRQGVSLQAQKDATAIQKVLISRKEKIEKALLEDNFVDKVKDEFRRLADDLNLIFGIGETQEKRTLDLAKQRMQQLVAWSRDAYGMTVEQLKANMVDEENIYHDWYVSMGDQADDASKLLLKKLRDLQDNITDAERKAANEQRRIFDKQWESVEVAGGGTMKSNQEVATKAGETQVKANETAQQYGFGGYYLQGNAEIDLIKLQIEWKERYIRMLAKQMDAEIALEETKRRNAAEDLTYMEINGASEEEYRKKLEEHEALKAKIDSMQHQRNMMLSESYGELNELNQQFMEKDVEIASHYLEKLKEYQDHFDTAAQSFGEAIFGSKEDRQNAGRELLKSVLTTTKNVIQQYLIELATKQQVNQMKEIMEQAHVTKMIAIDNQLLASQGTQAVQQLTMQGAQAQAENVINIARGTGKEVASKGLVGLATSAAISAGLSLLLGMALSAINKKKTEIQATTGTTRKLSTGMLTYAEGRYPVLGNDGVTYHAKYEDKLSTGIYRGGARFGIFSEKQPEAVIDGRTTQRIVMDYPYIWDAIMTIHRNGRLVNGGAAGMATHAAGTIQQVAETYANAQTTAPSDATPDSTNAQMVELMARMITLLENPVSPTINMYGPGGLSDSIKKANRFSQRTKQ